MLRSSAPASERGDVLQVPFIPPRPPRPIGSGMRRQHQLRCRAASINTDDKCQFFEKSSGSEKLLRWSHFTCPSNKSLKKRRWWRMNDKGVLFCQLNSV